MVIQIVNDRIAVGLRKEELSKVFLEPISPPPLTTPDAAPEFGLYSRSRGEATENEPMFGEVAWEPLLNHAYLGSSATAERRYLQKKILWDAWRYLVAQDQEDIRIIRAQLQGTHRQRTLLKELDKARKARTNSIRQRERRRARKAQLLDPNAPAPSIEMSDDDSGVGSDTEEDDGGIYNEDGRRMPPPSHAANRQPFGARRGPVARPSSIMSGGLGDFGSADRNMASSSSQTSASKRKRPAGPELQHNSRAHSESQHLFMTPAASGRPRGPEQNGEDDDELDLLGGHDANNGLSFKAAIAAARERSLAPGDNGSILDENGGLNFEEAMRAARSQSMAPESGS